MNYFAHAQDHLEQPYVLAGLALPDWLSVVDRKWRVRSARVAPLLEGNPEPAIHSLARGVIKHHEDDRWFHGTRAFAELSLDFAVRLREGLDKRDRGFRPSFLGHILVEILLDASLIERRPSDLDRYYDSLARVAPEQVAHFLKLATGREGDPLTQFIPRFLEARFLYDYAEDAKLLYRLNQVMQRVGLDPIPAALLDTLPSMRDAVRQRADDLLHHPQRA